MYYDKGNLVKLVETTTRELNEGVDPHLIQYTNDPGLITYMDTVAGKAEVASATAKSSNVTMITKLVDEVLTYLGTLISNSWAAIVELVTSGYANAVETISSLLWYLLSNYWLEMLIAAIVAATLVWLTMKVKRWWDGTSVIEAKLKKHEKRVLKKLDTIEKKIQKQLGNEKSNRYLLHDIKNYIDKQTATVVKQQNAMFRKIGKDVDAVKSVTDTIAKLHVDKRKLANLKIGVA